MTTADLALLFMISCDGRTVYPIEQAKLLEQAELIHASDPTSQSIPYQLTQLGKEKIHELAAYMNTPKTPQRQYLSEEAQRKYDRMCEQLSAALVVVGGCKLCVSSLTADELISFMVANGVEIDISIPRRQHVDF